MELLAAVWSLVGADEGWVLVADALWSAGVVVVVVVVVVVEGLAAMSLLVLAGAADALALALLADASGVVEAAAPDGAAPAALHWSAIILTSLT